MERSPSLLARRNPAFSPNMGCFSIEDLRGLYVGQSSDFRSTSLPRRLAGPRYNEAPVYNPSMGGDDEEDEDCNPDMFRKAKTQIHHSRDNKRSMFYQDSDAEESEEDNSDSDTEGCSGAGHFRPSVQQVPMQRASVARVSSHNRPIPDAGAPLIGGRGKETPSDAELVKKRHTQRPMRHGARSETMPVSGSGFPASDHTRLKQSSSEADTVLCAGASQGAYTQSAPCGSGFSQPMLSPEEEDVPSLARAGLGLVQSERNAKMHLSCAASTGATPWAELVDDVSMAEDSKGVHQKPKSRADDSRTGRARLGRNLAGTVHTPPRAADQQPVPAFACVESRSSVEIFFLERPRQSGIVGARPMRAFPTSSSLPSSGKAKDQKPPLSPSFPSSLSVTGSSTPDRSPKPPLSKLSRSARALVKCHSEIEKRVPSPGQQPKASSRALVRAHSESERGSVKPKSILVTRQSGLERASSLGRRVTFSEEIQNCTYKSKR